jgi:hypothetical protein
VIVEYIVVFEGCFLLSDGEYCTFICHHQQRFIESQDIPETENTFGLDGREAKFYMYIQSTTMERPDLERTMEQVLPYGKSIT